jgi:dTDP-4-dehydrorhamnose 3,5-epimerase
MKLMPTSLPGVAIIEPAVFADERGWFLETWNAVAFAATGLSEEFVQDNTSYSRHGVIRGLHYQHPHAQAKLVTVLSGAVFDVAVDIRTGSPTFGEWIGVTLSEENHRSLLIPERFAHGFAVTEEHAVLSYKCSAPYCPAADHSVCWNDPAIRITWPIDAPILSLKDPHAPRLQELKPGDIPAYASTS